MTTISPRSSNHESLDDGRRSRLAEERSEISRHDALYRQGCRRLVLFPKDWQRFDAPRTINPYIRSVLLMGDVSNRRVLDAGCGDGWFSVILAKRGAYVDGVDISRDGVQTAARRAFLNDVSERCTFLTGSMYDLPYDDAVFDVVGGQSILHHLSHKPAVAAELHRVMKPGARAIFLEPFGDSLVLEWLRLLVPVPSEAPDEPGQWKNQVKYRDLEPFRALFNLDVLECQFFSRLDRVVSSPAFVHWLGEFDELLLRALPPLRRFARSVIVCLQRASSDVMVGAGAAPATAPSN